VKLRPTISIDQLSARVRSVDLTTLADLLLTGVDRAAGARWEAAVERAASLPGQIRPQKIRALTTAMSRELAVTGAAAGVAAAAPAVGTAATLATATAEVAWFTTRAGDLILTIAALHGRVAPTVEERRAWVLAVLLYGGSAREGFTSVARQVGVEPGNSGRLPWASLRAINGVFSNVIVRRYGKKRGMIALGRSVPLGVGALIGGGANYSAIRALAKHADAFFTKLPYSAIDTTGTEVPAP
jgi:EcsC protein family